MTKPHALHRPEFPRSNAYDPDWVLSNQMGPDPLWLVEWLCQELGLESGMRVLDLGCGKALTSIFLAQEFGVQVWAADLWVSQDENWKRIREAGVEDRVTPLKAEAHALPHAMEFFDAVVSIDAYQYFGTDELYLGYLSRFVRPKGRIGVVVPGLMRPLDGAIPEHLTRKLPSGAPFWEDECNCFLTREQWRGIWERSRRVNVVVADALPDGWRHWRDFERELERTGKSRFPSVAEALDEDGGRYIGFIRLVGARRTEGASLNLYEPGLLASLDSGE